jgi:hypothetical protein
MHTKPSPPKQIDKPGMWGPQGGPPKDTLARRWEFYKVVAMHKVGKATRPFRTKQAIWAWRKFTTRVWKGTVGCLIVICGLLLSNMWLSMVYHSYSIGPSTPVLERKVKEHRISKQILQMVREREREIVAEKDEIEAATASEANKK